MEHVNRSFSHFLKQSAAAGTEYCLLDDFQLANRSCYWAIVCLFVPISLTTDVHFTLAIHTFPNHLNRANWKFEWKIGQNIPRLSQSYESYHCNHWPDCAHRFIFCFIKTSLNPFPQHILLWMSSQNFQIIFFVGKPILCIHMEWPENYQQQQQQQ